MDKKSSEKELLDNDDESKSFIKQIYSVIRENWLAFLFALIISLITIIAVPIVYSIETKVSTNNGSNLAWNVTGITIFNTTLLASLLPPESQNLSLGLISAIGFDDNSNLYIVDKTYHRVYRLNKDYNVLKFIGSANGLAGSDLNSLNSPHDIYIASPNKIYIADTNNSRIVCWDPSIGNLSLVYGSTNSPTNPLNSPMSVTMDSNSIMYVADYGNNRIVSFNINDKLPKFSLELASNQNNERETYVITPITIKYDTTMNSIIIAQETGYNVIRWDTSSTPAKWTLIAGSASSELSGTSRTLFNKVCYANVDPYGNTYVADCYNQRIQYYQGDLTKGRTIAGVILAKGTNPYLFNQPTSVTLDKDNNLYVSDSNNYRIQKFLTV
ncbi:unnamed protein product [Rotaria magnacalcarata]|uniref:NHL repeat containing protein n=2 Tax=Rotaria magnacalcarata TaxID=392030 RepID=A0A816YU76_9BILA|nr:unnamed protein product [Rotaria magnacalcarata]CAF2171457.1 unnamed protein product [Rotaria magnacalcarata]CAF3826354.1 unnamed protein product [Rotaria magnacalcarata]